MTEKEKLPFHEAVKKAMDGRTNKILSERSGINEADISRILKGRLIPTDEQKENIKKVFPTELSTY